MSAKISLLECLQNDFLKEIPLQLTKRSSVRRSTENNKGEPTYLPPVWVFRHENSHGSPLSILHRDLVPLFPEAVLVRTQCMPLLSVRLHILLHTNTSKIIRSTFHSILYVPNDAQMVSVAIHPSAAYISSLVQKWFLNIIHITHSSSFFLLQLYRIVSCW